MSARRQRCCLFFYGETTHDDSFVAGKHMFGSYGGQDFCTVKRYTDYKEDVDVDRRTGIRPAAKEAQRSIDFKD